MTRPCANYGAFTMEFQLGNGDTALAHREKRKLDLETERAIDLQTTAAAHPISR